MYGGMQKTGSAAGVHRARAKSLGTATRAEPYTVNHLQWCSGQFLKYRMESSTDKLIWLSSYVCGSCTERQILAQNIFFM